MKSILLASASLVAFAGAAAAEVTFSGSATLGYQDTDSVAVDGDDYGFYWDANLDTTLSMELDNGLTAAATFSVDVSDNSTGLDLESTDYVLSLTSDMGSLYFGATSFAAETYWDSVGDMEADGFSEADGETVLRGEIVMYGVTAGLSYVVADADGDLLLDDYFYGDVQNEAVDQMSVGATGAFGAFTFSVAYQEEALGLVGVDEDGDGDVVDAGGTGGLTVYDPADANEDFNSDEIFGISVGTSFAGADVSVGYAENMTAGIDSLGLEVSYPFGPVTATVYYVAESADGGTDPEDNYGVTIAYSSGALALTFDYDNDQGTDKYVVNGSYDLGNGLIVYAGMEDEDPAQTPDYYVATEYDMGGGASLLFGYAVDDEGDNDEIGSLELEEGATLELSFDF